LRGQVEHYRSLQETVSSDSPADAKIIQLAKKIKTLAVAVEREKGRSARLEKELVQAQQERLKAEAWGIASFATSKEIPSCSLCCRQTAKTIAKNSISS
jgi:hypothetical protein